MLEQSTLPLIYHLARGIATSNGSALKRVSHVPMAMTLALLRLLQSLLKLGEEVKAVSLASGPRVFPVHRR